MNFGNIKMTRRDAQILYRLLIKKKTRREIAIELGITYQALINQIFLFRQKNKLDSEWLVLPFFQSIERIHNAIDGCLAKKKS